MTKTRKLVHLCRAGLVATAAAGVLLAAAPVAAGHTRAVTLAADTPYRGYDVQLRAVKDDEVPVRISVTLRNGVQTHQYSFEASRAALRFGPDLESGRLRLAALSDESGDFGGGTIRFAAAAPLHVERCSDRRVSLTRLQVRTDGRLRFSPTQMEADEFQRLAWHGTAEELRHGGCIRPITCKPAARLSAYRTDQVENYAVLAWRFRSGGPLKVQGSHWLANPDSPAIFIRHTRTVRADRSRFSVTGFSQGAVDLDGIPGFEGSFEVEAAGPTQTSYGPCEAEMIEGAAGGTVTTAFDFVPEQTASVWSGGMIYKD
jgi:hypothetical protein